MKEIKMNNKITVAGLIAMLFVGFATLLAPVSVHADCGGVETAILNCSESGGGTDITNSGVWGILRIVLNIMTAGVAIGAIAGLVYAGVLYASAADSQEQVKKALDTIRNVVIGIVLFAGMYIAVNYLVPGGILG